MTAVRVLETNVLHASDVIYWLDGSTGADPSTMLRVASSLNLQLTSGPKDLRVINGVGKTAFLRRPTNPIVDGVASVADKTAPVTPTYSLAGVVSDIDDRFVPRKFSIQAGNAAGHGVVIYPSPFGTRFGPAGGLLGTLRFSASGAPVPWALLTLTVTTVLGGTLIFRGQADAHGDFTLPLNRLPPLPEGIADYSAELTVQALESAVANQPVDPIDLQPRSLLRLTENTFANPIGLSVVPGEIRKLRSFNQDHVTVLSI